MRQLQLGDRTYVVGAANFSVACGVVSGTIVCVADRGTGEKSVELAKRIVRDAARLGRRD